MLNPASVDVRVRVQAAHTRRRVLVAARGLLLEQGYAAVSMAAVAGRAEVSVALLYKTFGSNDLVHSRPGAALADGW